MKMSDVRVGMRLRSTVERRSTEQRSTPRFSDDIEVTALTTHVFEVPPQWRPAEYSHAIRVTVEVQAFQYRIPDDIEIVGPHWSMSYSRDGHEYYASIGSGGDIDYEPIDRPELVAELEERERMLEVMY